MCEHRSALLHVTPRMTRGLLGLSELACIQNVVLHALAYKQIYFFLQIQI